MYYKYHFFGALKMQRRDVPFLFFSSLQFNFFPRVISDNNENGKQIQQKHNILKSLGTLVSLKHHCFITPASFSLAGKNKMPRERREKDTLNSKPTLSLEEKKSSSCNEIYDHFPNFFLYMSLMVINNTTIKNFPPRIA